MRVNPRVNPGQPLSSQNLAVPRLPDIDKKDEIRQDWQKIAHAMRTDFKVL